jgi:hypothetical protein
VASCRPPVEGDWHRVVCGTPIDSKRTHPYTFYGDWNRVVCETPIDSKRTNPHKSNQKSKSVWVSGGEHPPSAIRDCPGRLAKRLPGRV